MENVLGWVCHTDLLRWCGAVFCHLQSGQPLAPEEVFEDVMQDYARQTVTMEPHPHLASHHASVHPCKVHYSRTQDAFGYCFKFVVAKPVIRTNQTFAFVHGEKSRSAIGGGSLLEALLRLVTQRTIFRINSIACIVCLDLYVKPVAGKLS